MTGPLSSHEIPTTEEYESKLVKWKKLVRTNPKRVVDALVIQEDQSQNSWGDTVEVCETPPWRWL